ncbi:ArsR/SmtB family transcription factor [Paraburkholderia sp. BCC1885]|uniref:ArsR/SmtB family transcription factor n=1 Tax=Paraburkholderia sp. BCC1885 TaxID=2562669 RepID=UPI00391FB6CA
MLKISGDNWTMPADTINIDAILKALTHPFRRQVLIWLADPEAYFPVRDHLSSAGVPAGIIGMRSGLSQSTVSVHLAQLEQARLVVTKRLGQWVLLSRNESVIHDFADWVDATVADGIERHRLRSRSITQRRQSRAAKRNLGT